MNEPLTNTEMPDVPLPRMMRMRVALLGLVQDFWKDAPLAWPKPSAGSADAPKVSKKDKKAKTPAGWTGDSIQVLEKLWGDGHVLPGGDDYLDTLIKPLGLTTDNSVLDLSAGLGPLGRKLAKEIGIYVTGMEPNPVLAARGMIMSIAAGKGKQAGVAAYDPATFKAGKKYDCIFARELFYRVADKEALAKEITASIKPTGGQIVITDLIMGAGHHDNRDIKEWQALEPGAAPMTSIETIKMWKSHGFDLRVAEDQTELYRLAILKGFAEAVAFFSVHTPDAATKPVVVRELFLWLKRLIAIDHGLRYYRFFGLKY